jgi:hypothetical protein
MINAPFGFIRCPVCELKRSALSVPREFKCKRCKSTVRASTRSAAIVSSLIFAPFLFLFIFVLDHFCRRFFSLIVPYPVLMLAALPFGILVHLLLYPQLLTLEVINPEPNMAKKVRLESQ